MKPSNTLTLLCIGLILSVMGCITSLQTQFCAKCPNRMPSRPLKILLANSRKIIYNFNQMKRIHPKVYVTSRFSRIIQNAF